MKRLILILFFLPITTNVMAYGIGLYGNYSGGRSDYTNTLKSYSSLSSINNTFYTNSAGGGVIFEFAAVTGTPVEFCYRFKVGGEAVVASKNIIENMYRINVVNLLYFKIFHQDYFSILLGPQIGTNYHQGTKKIRYPYYTMVYFGGPPSLHVTYNEQNLIIKSGGINLGLSLDLDFNISEKFVFFIQFGGEQNIYFTKYSVKGTQIIDNPPPGMLPGSGYDESHKKLKMNLSTEGTIGIGFLYKM